MESKSFKKFKIQVKQIVDKFHLEKDHVHNEADTKSAFILPMIRNLGYDPESLSDVRREVTCDIGKNEEKVDYAILKDGKEIVLIECKPWNTKDLKSYKGQLARYFQSSEAKIGVLTNGIKYQFFTDVDRDNIMDTEPFLEIDLTSADERELKLLFMFNKQTFDIKHIHSIASQLRFKAAVKYILYEEMSSPSDLFVGMIYKKLNTINKRFKKGEKEHLPKIIAEAFRTIISDRATKTVVVIDESGNKKEVIQSNIETTIEEIIGFNIICAILNQNKIPAEFKCQDRENYFAIFLDNNKKTLCQLWFNGEKKYIAFRGDEKKWEKIQLNENPNIVSTVFPDFIMGGKRISGCEVGTWVHDIINHEHRLVADAQKLCESDQPGPNQHESSKNTTESKSEKQAGLQPSVETTSHQKALHYFDENEKKHGPYSDVTELVELARFGILRENMEIELSSGWKELTGKRVPAKKIKELKKVFDNQ